MKWVFTFSQFTNLFVEHVENDKQLHLTFHIKKADFFGMLKWKTFGFVQVFFYNKQNLC